MNCYSQKLIPARQWHTTRRPVPSGSRGSGGAVRDAAGARGVAERAGFRPPFTPRQEHLAHCRHALPEAHASSLPQYGSHGLPTCISLDSDPNINDFRLESQWIPHRLSMTSMPKPTGSRHRTYLSTPCVRLASWLWRKGLRRTSPATSPAKRLIQRCHAARPLATSHRLQPCGAFRRGARRNAYFNE